MCQVSIVVKYKFKYMIFQRRQKALLWSKGLSRYFEISEFKLLWIPYKLPFLLLIQVRKTAIQVIFKHTHGPPCSWRNV